jgi:hypothetical protein
MSDAMKIAKLEAEVYYQKRARANDVAHLQAENERLRALVLEVVESLEDWAGYASDYFREKRDLAGTVAGYRAAVEARVVL